jgi:hypothetical protein
VTRILDLDHIRYLCASRYTGRLYAEIYASTNFKIVRQTMIARLKLHNLNLKFRISFEKNLNFTHSDPFDQY